MADDTIDSLKIDVVESGTEKAVEKLQSLLKTLRAIKNVSSSNGSSKTSFDKTAEAASAIDLQGIDKLNKLTRSIKELSQVSKLKISSSIATQITRIAEAVDGLKKVDMNYLADMTYCINNLKESGIESIKFTSPKVDTSGISQDGIVSPKIDVMPDLSGMKTFTSEVQKASSGVSKLNAQLENTKKSSPGSFRNYFHLDKINDSIKNVGRFSSRLKSVVKNSYIIKKLKNDFSALSPPIHKSTSHLQKFLSSIKRIAMYRAIRSAMSAITKGLKDGIDNFYQYNKLANGTFSKSMDSISTSFLYLKNSIGTAAAPLINLLAPAVEYVTDKFVDLINILNLFIAKLSGADTYQKAIRYANKYADASNNATKANEKLKRSILGIDELNVLTDNSITGGSSGSGSGLNYGSMFETVKVDSSFANWIDELKNNIENGDWKSVGQLISNKLIETMDNVDWNTVYAKASDFGAGLAMFLNGLFATTYNKNSKEYENVFTAVGKTIAGALNTALNFLNSFGDSFDFSGFGKSFGNGLSSFLMKFDWKTALSSSKKWGAGLADTLNGFLEETDWTLVGKTVKNAIINALTFFDSFVTGVDKDSFEKSIKDFLIGLDWKSIANKFIKLLSSSISLTSEIISASIQMVLDPKAKIDSNVFKLAVENAFGSAIGAKIGGAIGGFVGHPAEGALIGFTVGALCTLALQIVTGKIDETTIAQIAIDIFSWFRDAWNKAIDWIKEKIPVLSFLDKIKIPEKEECESIGQAIGMNVVSGFDSLDKSEMTNSIQRVLSLSSNPTAKNNFNLAGKSMAAETVSGFKSNNFGGLPAVVTGSLTSKNALSSYTATGSTVSSKIKSGFTFSGIDTKITSTLTGKTAKSNYQSSGSSAASSFSSGFKGFGFSSLYSTVKSAIFGKNTDYTGSGKSAASNFSAGFQKGLDKKAFKTKIILSDKDVQLAQAAAKLTLTAAAYADGGMPPQGDIFIANEAGPELVGRIGRRTAVANQDQIVASVSSGVSQGVYEANAQQNALLREQNELLRKLLAKDNTATISTGQITSALDRANRRNGKVTVPVG